MATLIDNRLVTRGFGPPAAISGRTGLVVQGYGAPSFVVNGIGGDGSDVGSLDDSTDSTPDDRPIRLRYGQSGRKRRLAELDEVIIWAKLMEVNNQATSLADIKGSVTVRTEKDVPPARVLAEHVASRPRTAWEFIKVTAQRMRST